ncbi:hypothetical protein [Mesorhizobium sp. J428]|uniref:hypothetical protein n=1 Tax=Mesorhizobium sp. J428 TaxID=2898440 RepID=UPI002150A646|nr:hypothetical protein [Mesorhizobium sp. J428]MCR5856581.1 hypothetical protein [Mesorhizobium sp. J428]
MAKGRGNKKFKHGQFAGWDEYRYGSGKSVTVAPIFRGEKRTHVIGLVMDAMRDWRQTPFESEGPVRAAIRSSLCLKGYGWARSDAQSAEVVTTALHLLGAERPGWEEGQRHYAEPRENCRWCYVLLSLEDQRYGFCSREHARFALERWAFEERSRDNESYTSVHRAMAGLRQDPRICANPACAVTFRPREMNGRFCSEACQRQAKRKYQPRKCAREGCGRTFYPKSRSSKDRETRGLYCSMVCHRADRWENTRGNVEAVCKFCGCRFAASTSRALYCSNAHSIIARRIDTGVNAPQRISPPVFDYVFSIAA